MESAVRTPAERLRDEIEAQRRGERDITLEGARQFAGEARNRGESFVYLWFRCKSRMSPWVIFVRVWGIQARVVKRERIRDDAGAIESTRVSRFCVKFNVIEILEAFRRKQLREHKMQAKPLRRGRNNSLPKNVTIR